MLGFALRFASPVSGDVQTSGPSLVLGFAAGEYAMGAVGTRPTPRAEAALITITRATGGGRINAAGQYEWLGPNTLRRTYDPVTLQPLGLLIEEQRTNLLLRSSDFDAAAWSKAGATITANSVASPDSTVEADKFVEDTTNLAKLVYQGRTIVDGSVQTLTVYAKAAERSVIRLQLTDTATANGVVCGFDLTTGTVQAADPAVATGAGVLTGASIAAVGDGWYRCTLTGSLGAGITSARCTYRLKGTGNQFTYLGDGTSGIYIWGAQLEAGASPTSYIPTEASQVTRAADVCSVNTLSPWYNPLEGTLLVKLSAYSGQTGFRNVVTMHAGAATQLYVSMDTMGITVSGVTSAAPLSTSRPIPMAIAGSYKVGEPVKVSKNGSPPLVAVNNVAASLPFTQMAIGRSTFYGGDLFNGIIESITYYPRVIDVQQASA